MSCHVVSTYAPTGVWKKTQLHCHCRGAGAANGGPKALLESYRELGYKAVAITDHHGPNCPNLENPVPEDPHVGDVVFIPALEDSCDPHMLAIGVTGLWDWLAHMYSLNGRMRKYGTDQGGFLVAAHPLADGGMRWSADDLTDTRLLGVEIKGEAEGLLWNSLIATRLLAGAPPIFGVCTDDTHSPDWLNTAWVVVQVDANPAYSNIVSSLKRGAFYSVRTGGPQAKDAVTPSFTSFKTWDDNITCTFSNASTFRVITAKGIQSLAEGLESDIRYTANPDDVFVRFEITDSVGNIAYSQPFVVKQGCGHRIPQPENCIECKEKYPKHPGPKCNCRDCKEIYGSGGGSGHGQPK